MDCMEAGMKIMIILLRGGFLVYLAVTGWQDYRYRRIRVGVFLGFGIAGGIIRGTGLILENSLRLQITWGGWPLAGSYGAGTGVWQFPGIGKPEEGPWQLAGAAAADIGAAMAIGCVLLLLAAVTREAVGKGDGWFFIVSGIYLGFWRNLALLWGSLVLSIIIGGVILASGLKKKGGIVNAGKQTLPFLTLAVPVGLGVLLL